MSLEEIVTQAAQSLMDAYRQGVIDGKTEGYDEGYKAAMVEGDPGDSMASKTGKRQFSGDIDIVLELWLGDAFESWLPSKRQLVIRTPNEVTVSEGEWIARAASGEIYVLDALASQVGESE